LSLEVVLNAFDAALIIGVAVPTLVMASRVKNLTLRRLTVLLSLFILVHGLYHLFSAVGAGLNIGLLTFLGDSLVEPTSYAVLLAFVIYYWRRGG
jgi:hypothetical protein